MFSTEIKFGASHLNTVGGAEELQQFHDERPVPSQRPVSFPFVRGVELRRWNSCAKASRKQEAKLWLDLAAAQQEPSGSDRVPRAREVDANVSESVREAAL